MAEQCAWCATKVGTDNGFRVTDPQNETGAAFCRLEHVVAWAIKGALWEPWSGDPAETVGSCARCHEPLGEAPIVIVRHRGAHRIVDGFCDIEHLLEWARAGGRYGIAGT